MNQLDARELHTWLGDATRPVPLLLDVREVWEFERCRIDGSELIPMASVPMHVAGLDPARETVVICHHGVRSFSVCRFLEQHGFTQVHNLTGGVAAWARDVDPAMPTY